MTTPPIFICGYTGSGKTTFGEILAEEIEVECESISDRLAYALEEVTGMYLPEDWKGLPLVAPIIRQLLYVFARGAEMVDPLFFIRQMIEDDVKIICGIRTLEELRAVVEEWPKAGHIWVQRPFRTRAATDAASLPAWTGAIPAEQRTTVFNSGTLDRLRQTAKAWAKENC